MSKKLTLADMTPEEVKGEVIDAMKPYDTPVRKTTRTEIPTTNDGIGPIVRTDFQ